MSINYTLKIVKTKHVAFVMARRINRTLHPVTWPHVRISSHYVIWKVFSRWKGLTERMEIVFKTLVLGQNKILFSLELLVWRVESILVISCSRMWPYELVIHFESKSGNQQGVSLILPSKLMNKLILQATFCCKIFLPEVGFVIKRHNKCLWLSLKHE